MTYTWLIAELTTIIQRLHLLTTKPNRALSPLWGPGWMFLPCFRGQGRHGLESCGTISKVKHKFVVLFPYFRCKICLPACSHSRWRACSTRPKTVGSTHPSPVGFTFRSWEIWRLWYVLMLTWLVFSPQMGAGLSNRPIRSLLSHRSAYRSGWRLRLMRAWR